MKVGGGVKYMDKSLRTFNWLCILFLQIEQDFEILFPGKGDGFYKTWPDMSRKLLNVAQDLLQKKISSIGISWDVLLNPGIFLRLKIFDSCSFVSNL